MELGDHSTQHEMAILIIHRFLQNTKVNYRKRATKYLKMLK